jgi:hypothetical protein
MPFTAMLCAPGARIDGMTCPFVSWAAEHPACRPTSLVFSFLQDLRCASGPDSAAGLEPYAHALDPRSAMMSKDGTDSDGRLRSFAKRVVMQHSMFVFV